MARDERMNESTARDELMQVINEIVGVSMPTGAAKQAVEELGRRIANDEYGQCQPIPTEPELAESLGVGRATVRDAIKVLSGKGMVRTARRYGTKVRPIEEWNLLDADVVSWHAPDHPRVAQMYAQTTELRCMIEPEAAALAAERASPEQIAALTAAANAMHPEDARLGDLFRADCMFHATLLDATGNLMIRQLRPIILSILRIAYEFGGLDAPFDLISRQGHVNVAEAIREGDAERARREMARMLSINVRTARDTVAADDAAPDGAA